MSTCAQLRSVTRLSEEYTPALLFLDPRLVRMSIAGSGLHFVLWLWYTAQQKEERCTTALLVQSSCSGTRETLVLVGFQNFNKSVYAV